MKYYNYLLTHKWTVVIILGVMALSYYYFFMRSAATPEAAQSFYVVDTVARGDVSSGIQTTGKIVAEQKLNLDVYKQLSRIDVVNVANGNHVESGKVLISFDKSDALVGVQSSQVALTDAQLALQVERANATDPNTQIRTLESQITGYQKSIADAEQSIKDAYQDFLNTDLEVIPVKEDTFRLADKTAPVLSGKYVGTTEGEYVVDIYRSAADSGYSFNISGLETGTASIYFGKAVDLGTRGLKITFTSNISHGDTWVIKVPNDVVATYSDTKRAYEQKVEGLNVSRQGYEVSLKNAQQNLVDLKLTDTSAYRDLNVEKAALSVSSEQQKLIRNYDVVKERDIVAPFSGTIQDMANVVVGATPTGGTNDSINLGTLISDTFLTTFTLSASDAAKVSIGQGVNVTVTSFANQPVFRGKITSISSLPASTGVAQYEITAKLDYDRTQDSIVLREGMLSDIEVVQQEKSNVVRVPISAITYEGKKATVKVLDSLTDIQKQEVARLGIVRTTAGVIISNYPVTVELGIQGKYYAEIVSGLDEGTYILTTQTTPSATAASVVNQEVHLPGSGINRTTGSTGGTSGASTQSSQ